MDDFDPFFSVDWSDFEWIQSPAGWVSKKTLIACISTSR